jgi:hypothetical protein
MLEAVAGWLGLVVLITAIAVTAGIEVLDATHASTAGPGAGGHRARGRWESRHSRRSVRGLVLGFSAAAIAVTAFRFYFYVH